MLSGYWNGGAGCSIETLAELIGDMPKVAFDHYGKEWGQHYQHQTVFRVETLNFGSLRTTIPLCPDCREDSS